MRWPRKATPMERKNQWRSIVALVVIIVAALLTRAECSAGHSVAECARAVLTDVAALGSTGGVVGIDGVQ